LKEVTVFQSASFELTRWQHSHGDGEWHDMYDVTPAHDSTEADPEREWDHARIYRCSTCEHEVRVVLPENERPLG